jgi:predicted HicB family RNase H-like nuclease
VSNQSSITVRVPEALRRRMAALAEKDGVSLNILCLNWLRAKADENYLRLIGADKKPTKRND